MEKKTEKRMIIVIMGCIGFRVEVFRAYGQIGIMENRTEKRMETAIMGCTGF